MPSIWGKSNKSHSSVDSSSGHPSPVPSVNNEASAQRYQSPEGPQQPHQNHQPPLAQQIPPGVSQAAYKQQFPARNPSHRHSAHLSLDQGPPQNFAGGQLSSPPQTSPGIEQPRRGSYQPTSKYQQQQQQEPKKQSLRNRIAVAAGLKEPEDLSRQASKNGLGRRASVKKNDGRPDNYQSQGNDRLQAAQWSQRQQGSSPHLPTSHEQEEDNLDPFLQQDDHDTPHPPPKDLQYQYAQNPHQEQYNRPPLARVNTEGSYHTQGGVDQYSPEQNQGLAQQQQHQPAQVQQQQGQPQYQSYAPPAERTSHEYQAFNPQVAPSPLLGNAQLHHQDLASSQQNYYQYPQPQSANQSPQDLQQQNVHYQQQQQQQFSPPPQPQQGQDFVQHGRPPSQHQPDGQQPQSAHPIPQIVQQGQQGNPQNLQLRPPSSHQNLAPPSPIQPPQYQAYDGQQGQLKQAPETKGKSTTPPQQEQDNMPPANQPRNTLRKVNETGHPQPGAPSRESSLLQQPQAQGQNQGQPPISPGIPSFGANVVPPASQGQPYRGDKGQQAQGGEMGRATPPPRSATDMSDEEIHQLVKDHEVLREKYQKVKRYFFEQQTQVHQLQNTLAHQRLSLSRTSWDDSEYATRFNRLDGLIAQLSFAIRKEWTGIPPWMQTVVNKNAVETGKQEMTAVGRAFISAWLVENIFDKYFHPDLEHNLSTHLKVIQLNIRKLSPTCQSPEDEDALNAKVVNWRLATLEGLADMLKSPQSPTNRQHLTENLNEQLIASLQMFLKDPAPPDLNGGVPMIVELAVSIAQHMPLESREVHIEYFGPHHGILSDFMKMESGIPALTNPILDPEDADRASLRSVASEIKDSTGSSIAEQDMAQAQAHDASRAPKDIGDKKRGMFGFGGGAKKPSQTPAQLGKRETSLGQGGSQQSLTQPPPGSSSGGKDDAPPPRVRLAVGVAVQIRGKSVLIKAPVYST
ncbi:hypothetical protein EJ04DRAFT_169890 [Polyplosphaeria fusca]|uniref:PAT1 multi-domain protein n=1 Tax=Polyplosphaeria fusca TaxID=682080 RepID=A0A9P4R430_9PLEO|nr:hypothetical protein EJ04DRAFT_169890 [Polyplosphaeria fusca]